jgi:hypothetical protein
VIFLRSPNHRSPYACMLAPSICATRYVAAPSSTAKAHLLDVLAYFARQRMRRGRSSPVTRMVGYSPNRTRPCYIRQQHSPQHALRSAHRISLPIACSYSIISNMFSSFFPTLCTRTIGLAGGPTFLPFYRDNVSSRDRQHYLPRPSI